MAAKSVINEPTQISGAGYGSLVQRQESGSCIYARDSPKALFVIVWQADRQELTDNHFLLNVNHQKFLREKCAIGRPEIAHLYWSNLLND
jgi:hypothetical protein